MERRFGPIQGIQIPHPSLDADMGKILQQVPFDTSVVVPLAPLGDFPTHEEQLLPRLGIHVAVEEPQIRELLPVISGHLSDEGSLPVNHLIVGEGKGEVLVKGVDHPEGQLIVMIPSIDGVLAHIPQGVMHPSHVPLESEAQSSHMGRP